MDFSEIYQIAIKGLPRPWNWLALSLITVLVTFFAIWWTGVRLPIA